MLIDLHAKTKFSDGVPLTPHQVLRQAQKSGLDGVAICDTASTARASQLVELANAEFEGLSVFIGVEIPTDRGILLGFAPQIDQFYLNEEWGWLTHRTTPSADAVIEVFQEQNGIVIAARPYDLEIPFNMGDYVFELDGIGGIEVFNPRVGQIQNNFALEAATFMDLGTTGGSDPSDDVSVIGQYATFFEENIRSQRRLVEMLRESEFWAVEIGRPSTSKTSSQSRKRKKKSRRGRR